MQYIPPINGDTEDPDRPYINADPALSIQGSIPPAAAIEHPQRELMALIDEAGLDPDPEDLTQVAQAVAVLIGEAIADLVASSPAALDTLNELAAALGNDENFATTMTNALAQKLGLAGGTLTNFLTLHADPTNALHAATKAYVDTVVITPDATTSVKGKAEILTDAEFVTGTDSSRFVVASNFIKTLGTTGRILFPGGYQLKWGTTGSLAASAVSNIVFADAFPTAIYGALAGPIVATNTVAEQSAAQTPTTTGLTIRNSSGATNTYFWLAWGR
ncbi:hypothetical protein [Parvibaculum sp.]|uniref:gp53-like domain-containing protein n=1 Tax=Parvibaculum sp. TaxID=2024848 RepID=UPI00272F3112|nr:hypothetical protein [Parvibaculum sp.]MDP1628868.1 hypothetical protein [Parvibaculum sp.]MDP2148263.1 hypothetical protein [Parvibaculum sp.]MDP3327740.1 hypothetical protein [Parvibaculum sp.]